MTKFILFVIILNLIVVIYNFYMWFKVGIENETLKKENKDLIYYLNLEYRKKHKKRLAYTSLFLLFNCTPNFTKLTILILSNRYISALTVVSKVL